MTGESSNRDRQFELDLVNKAELATALWMTSQSTPATIVYANCSFLPAEFEYYCHS